MKRIVLLLALVAVPTLADVNRVVLRVNDRIATLVDYRLRYQERLDALRRQGSRSDQLADRLAEAGRDTMCEMFHELLVLSKADQLNLEVSDEMVEDGVQRARQNNGIETDEQFVQALAQVGLTEQAFRDQVRRNLLIQQVIAAQLRERVELDEEDLRRYYQSHLEEFQQPKRVHLKEVVVLDSEGTPEERRELADRLAERAADGGLEKAVADLDAGGRLTDVIDLGWVHQGDLDENLESAAWDLPVDGVSRPVTARGGLHVLETAEVEEAHLLPFGDVKDEIENRERQRLFDEESAALLEEMVDTSYVVDRPPPEAAGYRTGCIGDESTPDLAVAAVEEAEQE
ncbi:MAG: peptidyl-prolyl cis-trans isomerase [Thermoanaerobaculia bacterium]